MSDPQKVTAVCLLLCSYIRQRLQTCLDWKNSVYGGGKQGEETGTLVPQMLVFDKIQLKQFVAVKPT